MKPDTKTSSKSSLGNKIAKILFDSGSVRINLKSIIAWASGIRSPIYCDNRILLSLPKQRKQVLTSFKALINESFPKIDVICGVASAGVPWASILAENLSLPLIYIRKEAKAHGKGKQIEGVLERGANVLVIEDLISTGGSSEAAISVLKNEGAEVVGLIAIVTYGLKEATKRFEGLEVRVETLTNFEDLIEVGLASNMFSESDAKALKRFQEDPWDWEKE